MTEEVHASQAELAKYKKLVTMAKSSLEEKSKVINNQNKELEELKLLVSKLSNNKNADDNNKNNKNNVTDEINAPRQILRIVEDNSRRLWVLFEYPSNNNRSVNDTWMLFETENELDDYIQRVSVGPMLVKPHKCLTAEESLHVETELKLKLDQVTEEFRRFVIHCIDECT